MLKRALELAAHTEQNNGTKRTGSVTRRSTALSTDHWAFAHWHRHLVWVFASNTIGTQANLNCSSAHSDEYTHPDASAAF
jgi:hypothetical protein